MGNSTILRVIWILWLTGFDDAPFIVKRCVESWRFHNPTWAVQLVTMENLKDFVNFERLPETARNGTMTPQALSDVIRLNVLADRGGVWAVRKPPLGHLCHYGSQCSARMLLLRRRQYVQVWLLMPAHTSTASQRVSSSSAAPVRSTAPVAAPKLSPGCQRPPLPFHTTPSSLAAPPCPSSPRLCTLRAAAQDATMLCMTPLDGWVDGALAPSGFWMYRGVKQPPPLVITRENTDSPASWFMLSEAGSYIATRWRDAAHAFWGAEAEAGGAAVTGTTTVLKSGSKPPYFWMDDLFRELVATDAEFRSSWACVPYLSCEEFGQAHMLNGRLHRRSAHFIERTLRLRPPFALKLSHHPRWWPERPQAGAAVYVALESAEQRRVVGVNESRHAFGGVSRECVPRRTAPALAAPLQL